MCKTGFSNRWKIVDSTYREAVADVTSEALLRSQVGIVLGSGRLKHRRSKVGRIAEVLRKRIVRQHRPPAGEATSNVCVSRLVPALRGVLQQVDAADRERGAGHGDVRRQNHAGQKAEHLERPAWSNRSRSGSGIVNEMRTLQMHTVRSQITKFQRRFFAQTLFD